MSSLIKQAAEKKKVGLRKAGDATHDPADLTTPGVDVGTPSGRLVRIPLDDLTPNPRNPRDEDLDTDPETAELAGSMALIGQQQPALVVSREVYLERWPDSAADISTPWVLMIGSRRRAAARLNSWPTLECITRERVTPELEQLGDLAIHENVHRKGLNPLRLAYWLQDQVDALGTEQAVAKKVRKSQPWVNQLLQLLKLAPELQALVQSGELNSATGRALAKLPQKEQRQVLDTASALPAGDRERFWRARAWTGAPSPSVAGPVSPGDAAQGASADDGTGATDNGTASAAAKPGRAEPVTPARPTTVRVRIGNPVDTAADLRKHLDPDAVLALVTELKRKRVGQVGGRRG